MWAPPCPDLFRPRPARAPRPPSPPRLRRRRRRTLALAVGANTAIFTLVRAVVLRPLPFTPADRLVAVQAVQPGIDQQPLPIADFLRPLKAAARSLDALVAWGGWTATLTGVDEPVAVAGAVDVGRLLRRLLGGPRPVLGRLPLAGEERPGAPRVVLLGVGSLADRISAPTRGSSADASP